MSDSVNSSVGDVVAGAGGLPVVWQLRRAHDGSVISNHCGWACAEAALAGLAAVEMAGPCPSAPGESVEAWLVQVATGAVAAYAWGTPSTDGWPPAQR